MKTLVRGVLALAFAALPLSALAQNYTDVSVYRVTKVRILPGKTSEFYKNFAWAPKLWEAEKAAGIILDYQIFHSTSYVGTDKWDVMYVVHFKNMAALDNIIPDSEPVIAKVYGTPENRAMISKTIGDTSETVSSELVRDMKLLPQK
jgi:hypothetical protein